MKPEISIVIPLYNETEVFTKLVERLQRVMDDFSPSTEVVLIDDGSKDDTALKIVEICRKDKRFQGVILSRNFGHQLALTAGLSRARGTKAIMVMDGDLQDPPELINDFYAKVREGFDVVYAVRKRRKEGPLKKLAYWAYYRLQKKLSSIDVPLDSGDFSMMTRRVVDHLNSMPEQSRYIRGMRSWVGYRQTGFEYERNERLAGETSYSWKQLFALAYNGIFNFSEMPVKFITRMGMLTIAVSLAYIGYTLYRKVFYDDVPQGFTALFMAIVLFSGVQLISLGIIGEYVLRIFFQVKKRDLFIVARSIFDGEEVNG